MPPTDPPRSPRPQPLRAQVVTPLVERAVIVEQPDQMVQIHQLAAAQPIVPTIEGPVPLMQIHQLDAAQRILPTIQGPVPLTRINQPRVPGGVPINRQTPLQQRVVNPRAQQAQAAQVAPPPLVILPAAARVRPTRYVYIPGLARDKFLQTPCADVKAFCTRVRTEFGYRQKRAYGGQNSCNTCYHDVFMTGAVDALCNLNGVVPINCGRSLRWVMITSAERDVYTSASSGVRYLDRDRKMYTSKAFKLLGAPQDNYMGLKPGKPNPPKELVYDVADTPHCVGSEYMAQQKGKPLAPNDQNQPARIEPQALAGLQDDDILYIVGHGNQRGGTLTYKVPVPSSHPVQDEQEAERQPGVCAAGEHLEKWYVDPATLAALLVDEGLPITHKKIEMVMCYGAGMALAGEQTVQPFCQRLAGALGGYGYKRINVRGTLGLVMSDLSINPSLTPSREGGNLIINTGVKHQVKPNASGHAKLYRSFAAK